jgi:enoyl-CoA hydratase/carnithine racemase
MTEHVVVERRGALNVIRMNRPEKKNAITRAMYAAMSAALVEGDADGNVRAHVFLGAPGAFSAGNDLADFLAVAMGGGAGSEVWDFLLALAGAAKPVVSGVDGIAVGIGMTLNLHCDVTLATPRTRFQTPFVDLGLVPEAASSLLLPRIVGHQRAFAILAMGEAVSSDEALALGLIRAVVAEEEVEARTFEAAERVAAKPPEALRIARDLIRGPRDAVVARIREEGERFQERLSSEEAKAAFMAFMARKKG